MKINVESRSLGFAIAILIIIFFLRFFSNVPTLIDGESYYNLRISNEIRQNAIIENDPLGGPYQFNIFHYLLAPFNDASKVFIPFILGILSAIFYFKILNKNYNYLALSLLLLSPLFLRTFMQLTEVMFATFLVLFNLLSLKNRKIILFTFSQTILVMTNFEIWLISTIYFLYKYRVFIAIIPGIIVLPFVFKISSPQFVPLFSELGATNGYSLFLLLLAIFGFFWRKKNPLRATLLLSGLMVSVFYPVIRMLGVFVMASYAASAIKKLYLRKWELSHIKQATIFLILLVIMFSAVAEVGMIYRDSPNDISGYEKLNSLPDGIVLSTPEEGHYIQYFAEKKVFVDQKSTNEKILYVNSLLKSQDHNFVLNELNNNNIKYLYLNSYADRNNILFIIDNSNNFTQIYNNSIVEIWQLN